MDAGVHGDHSKPAPRIRLVKGTAAELGNAQQHAQRGRGGAVPTQHTILHVLHGVSFEVKRCGRRGFCATSQCHKLVVYVGGQTCVEKM